MTGKWLSLVLGAVAFTAVLAGCLDFEEQTVYVEHDEKNDRLVAVVRYRGIYASDETSYGFGKTKARVKEAMEELQEAIDTETVAVGCNWPFAFPLKELRAGLKNPSRSGGFPLSEQGRKDLLTVLQRIQVLNAGFYLDAHGRICGAQVLIVKQLKDTVRLTNSLFSEAMQSSLEEQETLGSHEKLVLDAVRNGHTWLEIKGSSVIVSVPFTEEQFQELRQQLVGEFVSVLKAQETSVWRGIKDLLATPILVWHGDSLMKVKFGLELQPSVVMMKPPLGEYRPNLVKPIVEKHGLTLDESLAQYLVQPNAPAESDSELAARLMAPRLTKTERVGVLVRQVKTKPANDYWAKLREEKLLNGDTPPAAMSDAAVLKLWEGWLVKQEGVHKDAGQD